MLTHSSKLRIQTIAAILCILGIVLLIFLKNLSEADLGGPAILTALILILSSFFLFRWEENNFLLNSNSIPASVKTISAVAGLALFMILNKSICEFRLGGMPVVPNFFHALLSQSLIMLLGAGIYIISYPQEKTGIAAKKRFLITVLSCTAGIILLNFIFHSNIGDLTAEFKPTRRCYPGGSCYDAGTEQWGGNGALVLLSVNLLQGILALNILAGLFLFLKNKNKSVRTKESAEE